MNTETITVTDTAGGLNPEVYKQGGNQSALRPYPRAIVVVEDAPIRVRTDGEDPTASIGLPIAVGQSFTLQNANEIKGFRFIRSTGVSATMTVSYSSRPSGAC